MKTIINTETYDTDTAKKIGRWSDLHVFNSYEETLYKTPNDKFFLVMPNKDWDDDQIVSISDERAQRWLDRDSSIGCLQKY